MYELPRGPSHPISYDSLISILGTYVHPNWITRRRKELATSLRFLSQLRPQENDTSHPFEANSYGRRALIYITMKFRRRPSPWLLLLLPSIASAISSAGQDSISSVLSKRIDPQDSKTAPDPSILVDSNRPSYVGTKDAPVDGKDGKPHAGPFVDSGEKGGKKSLSPSLYDVDEAASAKAPLPLKNAPADPTIVDGVKIPQTNDGVMDDPDRAKPKQGTTGTEGGVSEKDKARKAQEGQTGERTEKKPGSPKEAPPLPESEQARIGKVKELDADDDGLAGLEVYLGLICYLNKANSI